MKQRAKLLVTKFSTTVRSSFDLLFFRVVSTTYSAMVLFLGFSKISLDEYGGLALALVQFAFFSRLISYGFDYIAKDIVASRDFRLLGVVVSKFLLFIPFSGLALAFIQAEYLLIALFAGVLFCFDLTPIYQARRDMAGLALLATAIYGVASIFLIVFFLFGHLSPYILFGAVTVPAGFMWFLYFIGNGGLSDKIHWSYGFRLLRKCFPMALVAQVPSLYTSIIPLLISRDSIQMVGVYYFLLRVANIGKMLGLVFNQTLFYATVRTTGISAVAISNAFLVGLFVCIALALVTFIFADRLDVLGRALLPVGFAVGAGTTISVLASYMIAEGFLQHGYFREYFVLAVSVIGTVMIAFWAYDTYTVFNGVVTCALIELALIAGAQVKRIRNNS